MRHRTPKVDSGHDGTVRERIHEVLLDGPVTARDVSQRVGIPEHDVPGHLEHLERSLKHKGQTLVIEPSACLDCGFAFTHRHRYTRPGHCPQCRGHRISLPRFRIER
jgi:hypothetical protein